MNNEELTRQDLIDSYVMGRMNAREQHNFEIRMDSDDTLAEDVAFLQMTVNAMDDIASKREMIADWGLHDAPTVGDQAQGDLCEGANTVGATLAVARTRQMQSPQRRATTTLRVSESNPNAFGDCRAKAGSTKLRVRPYIAVIGIAACLLVGFFLIHNIYNVSDTSSTNETSVISTPAIRGNLPANEAAELINSGKYEEALTLVMTQINELQEERETITNNTTISVEEREYTLRIIDSQINDLQQIRIASLLGLGRNEEAQQLQKEFSSTEGK